MESVVEIGPDIPFLFQAITKNAPYAWGNFQACAIIRLTATPGPGAASVFVDRHVTWQRPALLQAAAETTASGPTGKENLKADRRVRPYKEDGQQKWPLAGRATVPGVLYGIGHWMSLRRRTILSKKLRAPAPVELTIHTFRTVDRTGGRRFAVVARFGKR